MPDTTLEDFTALVRRAGLTLTDAQILDLYGAWGHVEAMLLAQPHAVAGAGGRAGAHLQAAGILTMDEFLTIAEASRLIASRKLSPVELTRQCSGANPAYRSGAAQLHSGDRASAHWPTRGPRRRG